MSNLLTLLKSRLEGLRTNPDSSWQARCPICALENHDRQRDHLRIWRSSAFRCVKMGSDPEHNKAIRAFLYAGANPDEIAALAHVEYIDPEPRLDVETVYPESLLPKLLPDYRYWIGRGVSEAVLKKVQGGLAPSDEESKMTGRYVFPVRNLHGKIIGWTGRLVSEASFGPKWKHLVRSSRAIYPCHVAAEAIRATRKIVLLESIGDGLALATHGDMWNWLVMLGLNLNSPTIGFLLSVNPTHVIVSTNNDAAGSKGSAVGNAAADKICGKLIRFFGEDRVRVMLPPKKDWGECSPEEIKAFAAEVAAL